MTETIDPRFNLLAQKIVPQSHLRRAWPLVGGVSAQVIALEIEHPDGTLQKMVVRQHGSVDLKRNPNIAADEFKLLQILQSAGVAAPKPYYVDTEIFDTPCIVIEFIEGTTEVTPADVPDAMRLMAVHLAMIHQISSQRTDLSFLPKRISLWRQPGLQLDHSLDEERIRLRLRSFSFRLRESVLLHGDYWPGNILWKDGRVAAVIDWEDATYGIPLVDLANARLEVLWAFGRDAMDLFTAHYKASMPDVVYSNLPYWDLVASLKPMGKLSEWAGSPERETIMRDGHKAFVAQAFQALNE